MAKMDKHARQEVMDNEWLNHEVRNYDNKCLLKIRFMLKDSDISSFKYSFTKTIVKQQV